MSLVKTPVFRVAKPTSNLKLITRMYQQGLSLQILSEFHGHNGFDGVILGTPKCLYHLEFTFNHHERFIALPTNPENALVFYLSTVEQFEICYTKMQDAGFKTITAINPYWDTYGKSLVDFDNNVIILSHKTWDI
jgi:hypothetical protein